jgi:hypothetical protein
LLKRRLVAISFLTAIILSMAIVPGASGASLKWETPYTLDCSNPGFMNGGTRATGVVNLYDSSSTLIATVTVSCTGSNVVIDSISTGNVMPASYELWVYIYAGSTLEATCNYPNSYPTYYPNILYCSSSIYGGATLTLYAPTSSPADILEAFGTASVDGVVSPGEYGSCIGPVTQGAYVFTFCETNDNVNDHYAFSINDLTGPNLDDLVAIFFDSTNSGTIPACGTGLDDLLLLNGTTAYPQFVDANYCATSGWNLDVFSGGTNDVTRAVTFTPGVGYTYEVSHPLNSGDSNDYALTTGSTVGWCLIYFAGPDYSSTQVQYPSGCISSSHTFIPSTAAGFGEVVKVSLEAALTKIAGELTDLKTTVQTTSKPQAFLALLDAATNLVKMADPPGSSQGVMMLHGAIGQLNAFIALAQAENAPSTWITQATTIINEIQAIFNSQ